MGTIQAVQSVTVGQVEQSLLGLQEALEALEEQVIEQAILVLNQPVAAAALVVIAAPVEQDQKVTQVLELLDQAEVAVAVGEELRMALPVVEAVE